MKTETEIQNVRFATFEEGLKPDDWHLNCYFVTADDPGTLRRETVANNLSEQQVLELYDSLRQHEFATLNEVQRTITKLGY